MTYKEIELKIYNLKRLGFKIKDAIYLKAIRQRALLERTKFNQINSHLKL